VIVNDFGHGMIDAGLIDIVCRKAKFLAVNAQTNSANRGFNLITKYPRADFICIDEPEARLAVADRYSPIETVICDKLQARIDCSTIIVTHGKLGSVIAAAGRGVQRIPALIDQAIDTIGAGDAFFSVAAPLVGSGCDPFLAGFIGNAVGAMKIRIVGHRHHITRAEVTKYLTSLLK
jgi:sugar/nucleoside kinase (ribokinase family)